MRLLLIGLFCLACGLDDLESGQKFISKTQEDHDNFPTGGNPGKHQRGGAHQNAYLINKVHAGDNAPQVGNTSKGDPNCAYIDARSYTCNLKVDIYVGWYEDCGACDKPLPTSRIKPVRLPGGSKPGSTNHTSCTINDNDAKCTWRPCMPNAANEVNRAIEQWLTPLRPSYNEPDTGKGRIISYDRAITYNGYTLSQPFTSLTSGQVAKRKPDLIINFICSASLGDAWDNYIPEETNTGTLYDHCPVEWKTDADHGRKPNGQGQKSCTLYETADDGDSDTQGHDGLKAAPIDPETPEPKDNKNIPVIFIGDADPNKAANLDLMNKHDRFDLLHEIGHAFGLADTAGGDGIRDQPRSIMHGDRVFVRGDNNLLLGYDDRVGVQWLYHHHREDQPRGTCATRDNRDEYDIEPYGGGTVGCEQKYPLITALKRKQPQLALELLDKGKTPSLNIGVKEAGSGNSALHLAIIRRAEPPYHTSYDEIIRKIINYRINPNILDINNRTALFLAVQHNLQHVVTLLLSSPGITVALPDRYGDTPLHLAARLGFSGLIHAMRYEFSSHVTDRNGNGENAMHLAAAGGHIDAVKALTAYPDGIDLAGIKDNKGNTALHLAAKYGRQNVVEHILRDPALLNVANNNYETPLHLAAKFGHTETVAHLLRQVTIEVNPQDKKDGDTPLHMAARRGHTEVVRLLLNKTGVDTEIKNKWEMTARAVADDADHTAVVKVFDGGQTRYGTSAAERLVQALKVGNIDPAACAATETECRQNSALSILRADENLDVNYVEPSTGNTALHYAVLGTDSSTSGRGPYETVVDLLTRNVSLDPNKQNEVDRSTPLHLAVQHNQYAMVKLLLRHRSTDVNLTNRLDETALHIAVDEEHEQIIAELLRYRLGTIDVNLQDQDGYTPLHVAAEQRSPTQAQMLIDDRRVDVNMRTRDSERSGALHIAAEYGNDEVVRALLSDADINVNLLNRLDQTALHVAAYHGREQVVSILLDIPTIDLTLLDYRDRSAYRLAADKGLRRITTIFDNQNKGDDVIFRGSLMEELRDKENNEDVEDVALDILRDDEDDLDINEKDRTSGNTPLHYAIEYKYARLVAALLLRSELQINLQNKTGATALITAVREKQTSTVAALLRHRQIQVNQHISASRDTALLVAVRAQSQQLVELLVAHNGIDANRKDTAGKAALHLAVSSKNRDLVRGLLRASNIDVNLPDKAGKTALHLAVDTNYAPVVTELLRNDDLRINESVAGVLGQSALHLAIWQHVKTSTSYSEVIDLLLAHDDIDPNLKNRHQESPLIVAAKEEDAPLVAKLLAHDDIEVNSTNDRQKTALMFASERGSTAIVRALLAHDDIDANLQDDKRFAALNFAAHRGHLEVTRLLLGWPGINIAPKDKWNLDPRGRAAQRGYSKIVALFDQYEAGDIGGLVKLLTELARGDREDRIMDIINDNPGSIAINAKDTSNNYTALHYAAKLGYERVVTALLGYSSIKVNEANNRDARALHLAARQGHSQIVQALLRQDGIQVNVRDRRNATPLHQAAAGGHYDVVQMLLRQRDIRAGLKTHGGYTVLHWAAQRGDANIARALLTAKASLINQQNDDDRTALYYAAWFAHQSVVETLLDEPDVNTNLRDVDGETALHKAASYNSLTVARMLLDAGASPQITNRQRQTARDMAESKGYAEMVALIDRY